MAINNNAPESVTILGSTGSIGCNTVKVLTESAKEYKIEALTANSNVKLLAEQAKSLNAKLAVIADDSLYNELKELLSGSGVEAAAGENAVMQAAARDADIVMSAIVGAAGLLPTMEAIKRGAKLALANKECLVCAGDVMMDAVKKYNAQLIPVDSEHNAIFQIFDFEHPEYISKIILTASGGPFRNMPLEQMSHVTPKQAIAHPNWSMGDKISIDSATMMNKGLEIIEAYYLFPVEKQQIDVVVHPESIIHSMVEYHDGSVLAQLGTPDMCTPISVAVSWPERVKLNTDKLNLTKTGKLTFEEVDSKKFPCIVAARNALNAGGAMPAILNSANEIAVDSFLKGQIGFTDIADVVNKSMQDLQLNSPSSVDDVLEIINTTRAHATQYAALTRLKA